MLSGLYLMSTGAAPNTNDSQVMNSSSHGALDVFSLIFGSDFKSLFSKSVMYQKH